MLTILTYVAEWGVEVDVSEEGGVLEKFSSSYFEMRGKSEKNV